MLVVTIILEIMMEQSICIIHGMVFLATVNLARIMEMVVQMVVLLHYHLNQKLGKL